MELIKLSCDWCSPCRAFASTFHEIQKMDEYKNIKFKEIDIEKDDDGDFFAEKYQIKSIPTTILLDDKNELLCKIIGNVSKKDFIAIINEKMKQ